MVIPGFGIEQLDYFPENMKNSYLRSRHLRPIHSHTGGNRHKVCCNRTGCHNHRDRQTESLENTWKLCKLNEKKRKTCNGVMLTREYV